MLYFSPFTVKAFRSFTIGRVSLFYGIKRAEVMSVAIQFYACDPFFSTLVKANALISAGVIFLSASIPVVLGWSSVTQVFPAVVGLVFILVVYFVFWPFAFHVQICKAVRHVFFIVNSYLDPVFSIHPTCGISRHTSPGKHNFPCKNACQPVVTKNRTQIVGRQVGKRVFVPSFHWGMLIPECGTVKRPLHAP